jgi:hypothetical protein
MIARPLLLAGIAAVAAPAAAQEQADAGLQVILTGYLWGSALDGETSTVPPLPAANVDLSFGDVLEDLDGGAMAAIEVRSGPWSFLGDAMFTQTSPDGTGPLGGSVELRTRSLTLQAGALRRVHQAGGLRIDAGAGLRLWSVDARLTLDGPGGRQRRDDDDLWIDPVLIGRAEYAITDRWSVSGLVDAGGFDVGASFTWQAVATVNRRLTDSADLRVGYRALSVNRRDGDFVYDVALHGPVVGVDFRF